MKFKYNYQNNTLAYQKHDLWYQISEENYFTTKFGGPGFKLDSGWITFTIQANKIKVFYKQMSNSWADLGNSQTIAYFSQDLPKECPVIFEFTEVDQIEKIGNKWVKKGGNK